MNGFNCFIGAIATIILRNITPQYTAIIFVHPTWGRGEGGGGGLAVAFDLAAFQLSMIAPIKESVNHSRIVASMHETG